jgi:hypothetical protein
MTALMTLRAYCVLRQGHRARPARVSLAGPHTPGISNSDNGVHQSLPHTHISVPERRLTDAPLFRVTLVI